MTKNLEQKVIELLAEVIGVERDDIKPQDDIKEDLHMDVDEQVMFTERLKELGIEDEEIDFSKIETVEDLIEHIQSIEEI